MYLLQSHIIIDNRKAYCAQQRITKVTEITVFVGQIPISYTHLDVYKRQDVYGAAPARL